jgi:hypothetical protein
MKRFNQRRPKHVIKSHIHIQNPNFLFLPKRNSLAVCSTDSDAGRLGGVLRAEGSAVHPAQGNALGIQKPTMDIFGPTGQ